MPVTATRTGINAAQSNTGLRNPAIEQQKKRQEVSRVTTRNIAVGVITVAALATAAYFGRDYIFGAAQTNQCKKVPGKLTKICENKFIADYSKKVGLPAGSEFSKAYSIFLNNSKELKACITQLNKEGNNLDLKFCVTNPTHWRCV